MRTSAARWTFCVAGIGVVVTLSGATADAHFILESPPASAVQDPANGNPQKTAPCGPSGAGTPTGAITTYQAGTTITVTIDEKIPHDGHYRVALAVNDPSELPDAPPVTPTLADECDSTVIQNPPVFPVLADGMLPHTDPFDGPQSFEVTLPSDVTCDNCTLQVIEYMKNHGAPCFYYHCATIAIQDEPVMATSSTNSSSSTANGGNSANGGSDGTGGAGGDGGTGAASSGPGTYPNFGDGDSGCSWTAVGTPNDIPSAFALLGLAALAAAIRRRR